MIGTISAPVLSSDVTPIPPVTLSSGLFFMFDSNSGYVAADTLKPGRGYWVKVTEAGKIVMKSMSLRTTPASR